MTVFNFFLIMIITLLIILILNTICIILSIMSYNAVINSIIHCRSAKKFVPKHKK